MLGNSEINEYIVLKEFDVILDKFKPKKQTPKSGRSDLKLLNDSGEKMASPSECRRASSVFFEEDKNSQLSDILSFYPDLAKKLAA